VAVDAERVEVEQLQAALECRDATTIGQAYAGALQRRLVQISERPARERSQGLAAPGTVDDWLMIVSDGEDRSTGQSIDASLWLDVVIAAADALGGDPAVWCVGDGPADHLVGEHPEMATLLHAARASHPGVDAMFQAMLQDYQSMGYPDAGWWSDPSALSS
jgi:hypothetical protein